MLLEFVKRLDMPPTLCSSVCESAVPNEDMAHQGELRVTNAGEKCQTECAFESQERIKILAGKRGRLCGRISNQASLAKHGYQFQIRKARA